MCIMINMQSNNYIMVQIWYIWRPIMVPTYVKTGFCPDEIEKIDNLVAKGFGKSKSDFVRKATNEYIARITSKME